MSVSILAFAGSAREQSFNKKLVAIAAGGAVSAGADVTAIDLRDYSMPIMDQDLEEREGLPEHARKIKQLMKASDGFLIAAPEYNSGITPLLKNVIDWASRAETDDEPPLAAYRNKVAAIMSASPGGFGGLRGLVQVRSILGNIGVTVLPEQVAVAQAHEAFTSDGSLKDGRKHQQVAALGSRLVRVAGLLRDG